MISKEINEIINKKTENPKFEDFIVPKIDLESENIQDDILKYYEMIQYPVPKSETVPTAGNLFSHQANTARILSNLKGDTGFIIKHITGSGKTRIPAKYIEGLLEDPAENHAIYVILGNENQKIVINTEISKSNPQKYGVLTSNTIITKRVTNLIGADYKVMTKFGFRKEMAKSIRKGTTEKYKGATIWVDEVQGLAIKKGLLEKINFDNVEVKGDRKNISTDVNVDTKDLKAFYEYSSVLLAAKLGAKVIATSYTPASTPEYINSIIQLVRPNTKIPKNYDWIQDSEHYFRGIISVLDTIDVKIEIREHGTEIGTGQIKRSIYEAEMSPYQSEKFFEHRNRVRATSFPNMQTSIGVFPDLPPDADIDNKNGYDYWFSKKGSDDSMIQFSDAFIRILDNELLVEKRKLPVSKDVDFKARINVIKKYSCIYASIIEINNEEGFSKNATVGIDYIKGSGTDMFCSFLNWMGYKPFNGKNKKGKNVEISTLKKRKRFAVISGSGTKSPAVHNLKISLQQMSKNYKGEYLEWLIYTSVGRSGFSFYNVRNQFDIFTSYVLTDQIQGEARIVRSGAYNQTIEKMKEEGIKDPKIIVNRYRMTSKTKQNDVEINDFKRVYELAFEKQKDLDMIYQKMKEESVDLKINRNRVTFDAEYTKKSDEGTKVSRYISKHMKEDALNYLSRISEILKYQDTYDLSEENLNDVFIEYILEEIDSKILWIQNRFGMDAFLSRIGYLIFSQVGWGGNSQYIPEIKRQDEIVQISKTKVNDNVKEFLLGKSDTSLSNFDGKDQISIIESCACYGCISEIDIDPIVRKSVLQQAGNLIFKFKNKDTSNFEHKRHKISKNIKIQHEPMEISRFMAAWDKLSWDGVSYTYVNITKFLVEKPTGVANIKHPNNKIRVLKPPYGWRDAVIEGNEEWFYRHLINNRMKNMFSSSVSNLFALKFKDTIWFIGSRPGKKSVGSGGQATNLRIPQLTKELFLIKGGVYNENLTRNKSKKPHRSYNRQDLGNLIDKNVNPNDLPISYVEFCIKLMKDYSSPSKKKIINLIMTELKNKGDLKIGDFGNIVTEGDTQTLFA